MKIVLDFFESSIFMIIAAIFVSLTFILSVVAVNANNPDKNGLINYLTYNSKVVNANNSLVSGSFVRQIIKEYKDDNTCSVVVFTDRCRDKNGKIKGFFIFDESENINSDFYINPSSYFFVNLLHDTDMQVVQIRFIEYTISDADSFPISIPTDLTSKFLEMEKANQEEIKKYENKNTNFSASDKLKEAYSEYMFYYTFQSLLGDTKWAIQ